MGCFDTVLVPCPKCKELFPAQSKSGECILMEYDLEDAPIEVLKDVNRHAPFHCEKCGVLFKVDYKTITISRVIEFEDVENAHSVVFKENDES